MGRSAFSRVWRYCKIKEGSKLLNVCNSKQATSLESGNCSLTACVVAFTLLGAWAKSLKRQLVVPLTSISRRFDAPLKVPMA